MKTMKLALAALVGTLLATPSLAQDKPKELVVGIATFLSGPASVFGVPGRKPSVSRVSLLTGLTRKEVSRLWAEKELDVDASRYHRGARIVTA